MVVISWLRIKRYVLLSLSFALSACTIWSGELGTSYQNRADTEGSYLESSVPVPRATSNWVADKATFVGLAFSGGGSRAANFGMAVLSELDAQGILPHVDAVSAVSGGSIPAAWFALRGGEPGWLTEGRIVAQQNFLNAFLFKMIAPNNIVMTTLTDKDRTDLLAEVFRDKVMGGKNITFGELGPRKAMKPAVYFNATDTTNGGERFVFTEDQFLRKLGSRLSDFPLSTAMASSGAFPGIFNSVTLRKFSLDPDIRKSEEGLVSQRQYVHLIDGGSSDNFGTDTLIDLARQHHIARLNRKQPNNGCMIMVVDSHVPNAAISDAHQSDRRNVLSMLIDLNFLDAIDALLSNRRNDTLHALGVRRDQPLARYSLNMADDVIEYNVAPYRRLSEFPITFYEEDGKAIDVPTFSGQPDSLDIKVASRAVAKVFMCQLWHIALDDVHSVIPWKADAQGQLKAASLKASADKELFAYRVKLARVIKQVPTNYKLAGPKNCSADFVQQALFDAAHIVVKQDKSAVEAVCQWFKEGRLDTRNQCRVDGDPVFRADYPVEATEKPRDLTANEQAIRRFVQCQTN